MNANHGDADRRWDLLISGVHLATFQDATGYAERRDAAIAVSGDRIAWLGSAQEGRSLASSRGARVREFAGAWVTPGLIDCHTHLVYGGNRSLEFEMRLNGATYEQISRAGGGIQSTVQATQAATDEELLKSALTRARRLCAEGVTTLEIKSGYGLDLQQELRLLRTARRVGDSLPVSVRGTFLGLHALPPAFKDRREEFVAAASGPWLDAVVAEGLADAVDAFCENIAFTIEETERLLRRARAANLGVHLHAGQLTDMGAAQLAARWQALSVDHLEYVDEAGISALAMAGTVAVMLPGAFYMLRQDQPPPVAALRRAGVPLAVATDCNPGTSPCTSLLLAMNMACTLFGMTPEEALAGVTREAARALGLADRGRLQPGLRADLAIWDIERPAELSYGLGANPCIGVVQGGNLSAS